ncbi:HD-GYP domain-containing protein [Geobacter sp. SVR]|uniref:HD-GYP domain-containing protein n=1 Tax=Geobacter sp. SVR TaxID=2495594 RepID=UPI00143EFBFD|nr:HD domain-containing phosphohydrolase [Geobacter sp. SVR]BCS53678.1 two-component system response regulator [Geobacter sp. SVR]GCF84125.1 two-component system response regulator [Geobacter sp. SVR]
MDDDPETHAALIGALGQSFGGLLIYPLGELALSALEHSVPDLILLAMTLPDMDGIAFCGRLRQSPRFMDIPVIFLGAQNDMEGKVRAFDAGAVDFVNKPFHVPELRARVALHLRLSILQDRLESQRLVERKIRELSEAQQATIFALAKLAEQRDGDTGEHLERVREYCRLLAEQLGSDSPYASSISGEFIECIQYASPLHDIGKVAIPDSILLKPHRLTPAELSVMETHSVLGAENLQLVFNHYSGNAFIGMGIEIALYHHEWWNGTGYPDGLIGRNIPLSARIMALADYYDALRSDRCYRRGFSHQHVKSMILNETGTHFDPVIVKAFLDTEEQFRRHVYPVDANPPIPDACDCTVPEEQRRGSCPS